MNEDKNVVVDGMLDGTKTLPVPVCSSKLIHVPVNLSALRQRIEQLLQRSFRVWNQLSTLYAGGDEGSQRGIDAGIQNPSSLTVLLVYEYLRVLHSKHGDGTCTLSHLKPGPFSLEKCLPSGLCTLVEQFGYAEAAEVFGCPRYLHVWDGELSEGYGLAPEHSVEESVLDAFLRRLQLIDVPFRCIQSTNVKARTLWDSLLIKEVSGFNFSVAMTYPQCNHILPQDIYSAIFLCGPSTLEKNAVAFYAPRLSRFDNSVAIDDARTHEPVEASDQERDAMPAMRGVGAETAATRANGALPGFHLTGPQHATSYDKPSIWIYGRGGVNDALVISELTQPIRPDDHFHLCNDLLTTGELPSYWLPKKEHIEIHKLKFRSVFKHGMIEVPVNLASLRERVIKLTRDGLGNHIRHKMWEDDWSIDADAAKDEYDDNLFQFATEVVLAIRDRLCHLSIGYSELRKRYQSVPSPFYHRSEFPAGICFLIEQFGVCETKSTPGAPTYIHVWDGEDVLETQHVSRWRVSSLYGAMRREGVPFRQVNDANLWTRRSLWDSLYVKKTDPYFDVYTTFPSDNYVLPRDVFLAILLCGESSLEHRRPIEYFAPRLARYTRPRVTEELERHTLSLNGTDEYMLLNGPLSNMSMSGTQKLRPDEDQDLACWIYGRGGAEQTMKINSVGRWVSGHDLRRFAEALFLK